MMSLLKCHVMLLMIDWYQYWYQCRQTCWLMGSLWRDVTQIVTCSPSSKRVYLRLC